MFKNKRIFIATMCIIGACVVAAVTIFSQKITLSNKTEVAVLQGNVAKGDEITEDKVKLEKRTTTETQDTAITDLKSVIGTYANGTLYAGDIITPEKISSVPVNGNNLISNMPTDKVAVSVPVSGANGLNGKLESGDIVQVYVRNPMYALATEEQKAKMDEMMLKQELQYMKILSITFSDATDEATKTDGGTYSIVTFECSQFQANKLIDAGSDNFYLAYVCHGDDQRAEGLLKAQADLNEQIKASAPQQ